MKHGGMTKSDSNGILDLCEGAEKRKQGTELIARQIELENMKVRQFKVKAMVNEKNMSLRQDQKMNQYLEKINREHFEIEQWQNSLKK